MLYTLREMATEENISYRRLLDWRRKGWLRPATACGSRERFTKAAFDAACRESLVAHHEQTTPEMMPVYDKDWGKRALQRHLEKQKPSDGGSRARGYSKPTA